MITYKLFRERKSHRIGIFMFESVDYDKPIIDCNSRLSHDAKMTQKLSTHSPGHFFAFCFLSGGRNVADRRETHCTAWMKWKRPTDGGRDRDRFVASTMFIYTSMDSNVASIISSESVCVCVTSMKSWLDNFSFLSPHPTTILLKWNDEESKNWQK